MLSWITILIVSLHWVLFGYTFSFGPGTPGFGSFAYVALQNIGSEPIGDYAPTIPHFLFVMYQMTFAVITAGLKLEYLSLNCFSNYQRFSRWSSQDDQLGDLYHLLDNRRLQLNCSLGLGRMDRY